MTGLTIGSIKARDEISEVVVVIAFRTRLLDTFVLVFNVVNKLYYITGNEGSGQASSELYV